MFDINPMIKAEKPVKTITVYSPKQCPFSYTAGIYGNCEEDYCGYLKSLHKIVEKRISFDGLTLSYEEEVNAVCFCNDEDWIEGCPLLKDDFKVVKN